MLRHLYFILILSLSSNISVRAEVNKLNYIVSVVNDDVITYIELKKEFKKTTQRLRKKGQALPPANVLGKQILEKMILELLQIQIAKKVGIRISDATLNRTMQGIAKQNNMHLSEFNAELKRQGINYADFREEIKKQLLLKRVQQQFIKNKIKVTEREIDHLLFNLQQLGQIGAIYHLSHILIALPEGATSNVIQSAKHKAQQLVAQLRQGENFRTLAIGHSDGSQALEGGDLGWRKAGEIPELFMNALSNMKTGDISDPLRSPNGFHIIQLNAVKSIEQHVIKQYKTRHILISPNPMRDLQTTHTAIQRIRERLINGDDFATLARSHSEDKTSASRGGNLGWITPEKMVPEFAEKMKTLPIGAISEPVKTEFGWHIIQVLEKRNYDDTEEFKRQKVTQLIQKRKIAEQTELWLRKIRDEAFVDIRLED